jgi:hypothetical protein
MSALICPLACTCYSALIFAALFYLQMAKNFNDRKCKSVSGEPQIVSGVTFA